MSMNYRSEIEKDYLHIVATGSVHSTEEMTSYISRIHNDMAQSGLSKALADETKCHIHISIDELKFAIAQVVEPKELESGVRKSAIICSAMNLHLFRHTFDSIEAVEIFTDEEEAKRWLAQG